MPLMQRSGKPTLHYRVDDFTDPWKHAGTIVLQHGFGRSAQFWYSWVPYLARYYKVVRPDLRGMGEAPVDFDPATQTTMEAYVEDTLALLDELRLDAVHFCGESSGGILGMILAAEHPERIRTLNLVSAPVDRPRKHQETFMMGHASREEALRSLGVMRWAHAIYNTAEFFPPGTDPALREWYANEIGKTDVEALCGYSELLREVTAEAHLPRIKAPVLGIYPAGTAGAQEKKLIAGIKDLRIVHVPLKFPSILTLVPATCALHVLHFAARFDGISCHE